MDSVLAGIDCVQALPRLGGMARPNGVAIVSERFWAFAGLDGSLREGTMPEPRSRLRRVPLVRGLVPALVSRPRDWDLLWHVALWWLNEARKGRRPALLRSLARRLGFDIRP